MDRLTTMIRVLQQLQRLLPISATLADVADLLACIEAECGTEILLEDVIQHFVGEHLAVQIAQRGPVRRSDQVELEVAA